MIENNKLRADRSVIGVILMICITVILSSIIAAFIIGMEGVATTPIYSDTITVHKIILLEKDYGIIDSYERGFRFYPSSMLKENKTYYITYYIHNNERYLKSAVDINYDDELYKFKCISVNGVCK